MGRRVPRPGCLPECSSPRARPSPISPAGGQEAVFAGLCDCAAEDDVHVRLLGSCRAGTFDGERRGNKGWIVLDTDISAISKRPPHSEMTPSKRDRARTESRLRWELKQVMSQVRPANLSSPEMSALLVILRKAHARVIGRPAFRPALRLLGGGRSDDPAPKLA